MVLAPTGTTWCKKWAGWIAFDAIRGAQRYCYCIFLNVNLFITLWTRIQSESIAGVRLRDTAHLFHVLRLAPNLSIGYILYSTLLSPVPLCSPQIFVFSLVLFDVKHSAMSTFFLKLFSERSFGNVGFLMIIF
jgi:hypothetical protein